MISCTPTEFLTTIQKFPSIRVWQQQNMFRGWGDGAGGSFFAQPAAKSGLSPSYQHKVRALRRDGPVHGSGIDTTSSSSGRPFKPAAFHDTYRENVERLMYSSNITLRWW